MAVTEPGQLELRSTIMGQGGDPWGPGRTPWEIFGVPVDAGDVRYAQSRGGLHTVDTDGFRVCTFPLSTVGADLTQEEAWEAIADLEETWAASERTDLDLNLWIHGLGEKRLIGRPRGAEFVIEDIEAGIVHALGRFTSADGVFHEPEGS